MPNDLSDAVHFHQFESGAFLTDGSGNGNILNNNNGVTEDTTIYKRGSQSAGFAVADSEYLNRANSSLHNGHPFKSDTTDLSFTLCFWLYYGSTSCDNLFNAHSGGDNGISIYVRPTDKLRVSFFSTSTDTNVDYGTAFTTGNWYHIKLSYDPLDDSYRLRIHSTSGLLGSEVTGTTASPLEANTADLFISQGGGGIDGNVDEWALWARVLSATEMNNVWNDAYSPPSGGLSIPVAMKHLRNQKIAMAQFENRKRMIEMLKDERLARQYFEAKRAA